MKLFAQTMRALSVPRRSLPIAVLSLALIYAQLRASDDWRTLPIAIALCVGFVIVAPTLFRYCFGYRSHFSMSVGAMIYIFGCALTLVVTSYGTAQLIDISTTFLTEPQNMLVDFGLFFVGGFGLGRDIELEEEIARERTRADALAREAEHAQLLALRSHLDPHFLFNTLNAIAEWCHEDADAAEQALLELSAMLRSILEGVREELWPLECELSLARALARLYQARDPERYRFSEDVAPEALSLQVPPLLTLPLTENAWKHGPAAGAQGLVHWRAGIESNKLVVRVINPTVSSASLQIRDSEGLRSVRQRLQLVYGECATFRAFVEARTFIAELNIPAATVVSNEGRNA